MNKNQSGSMHALLAVLGVIALTGIIAFYYVSNQPQENQAVSTPTPTPSKSVDLTQHTSPKGVRIIVTKPLKNQAVSTPLQVVGMVPGNWSFEATFPIDLVDENDNVIASGYAELEGDWMTEGLVKFNSVIEFDEEPATNGGYLVLMNANASGLPENDDSVKIPVTFASTPQ